jgi:predicted component of type VI protein secretion system
MKKIILVLGIILLGISCNNEQKKMDKMNNKILTRITNVCQLSPEQVTKILPITENFVKLRQATKDKYSKDQDGFKSAMEVNRKNFIDTIKTILTPDQFEKLKASFQQQKAKQGGDQDGGGQD